jgi:CHAT domain-containing protein/tetratricopeptide (TPR) repeat protein
MVIAMDNMTSENLSKEVIEKMIQDGRLTSDNPLLIVFDNLLSHLSEKKTPPSEEISSELKRRLEEQHFREAVLLVSELRNTSPQDSYLMAAILEEAAISFDISSILLAEVLLCHGMALVNLLGSIANPVDIEFLRDVALHNISSLLRASEIFDTEGSQRDAGRCNLYIGILYLMFAQYEQSESFLKKAESIFEHPRDIGDLALCHYFMAELYENGNLIRDAVDRYMSAGTFFKLIHDGEHTIQCYQRVIVLKQAAKIAFTPEEIDQFRSLQGTLNQENQDFRTGIFQLNLAKVLVSLNLEEEAIELLESALTIFEREWMDNLIASCLTLIGAIYQKLGNKEMLDAHSLREDAFLKNNRSRKREYLEGDVTTEKRRKIGLWIQDLDAHIKNDEMILDSMCRSTFELDTVLLNEAPIQERQGFASELWLRTDLGGVSFEHAYDAIDFCLKVGECERALEYVEFFKSRALTMLLTRQDRIKGIPYPRDDKQANLTNWYSVHRFEYPRIRDLVPADQSALIYLFPMEDKTVVFVVRKDRGLADGTELIADFSGSHLVAHLEKLSRITDAEEWETYLESVLEELGHRIFLRIESHLDNIEKLVFIPYSHFHLLPLHAMFINPDNGRRLIDNYLVSYAPSAKVLERCLARPQAPAIKGAVLSANPRTTKPLAFARIEAEIIGKALQTAPVFEATRADVIEKAKQASILHYSGHADGESLLLHGERRNYAIQPYCTEDILTSLYLPNSDLVVLSACETGKTRLGKLDEYIGVASSFLLAGTSTVVSSLWEVDDASTCLLMKRFYENLKNFKEISKAEALRDAQLWVKSSDPEIKQEQLDILRQWFRDDNQVATACRSDRGLLPPRNDEEDIEEDIEEILKGLSSPRHWAAFFCSGAG